MQRCPLCRSTRFKARQARTLAECAWCGALERTRMVALGLDRIPADLPAGPFLHFSPEESLYRKLRRRFGDLYTPCAADPDAFKLFPAPVRPVDIAAVADHYPAGSLAGILHSHVLDHTSGDSAAIVSGLNAALAPGGVHLFTVGLHEDRDADRLAGCLSSFDGWRRIPFADLIQPAELEDAAIPEDTLAALTPNTVFGYVKP